MQHLSKLLEIENSNLAWTLRLGLHGLRAQLQEALKIAKTDPGSSVCEELLRELDNLLELKTTPELTDEETVLPVEDNSSWEDVLEPVATESKLRPIAEAILSDRDLSNYIGQYEFRSTNDSDLWNEIQYLLLRVPEKIAHTWREQILKAVSQLGAVEDKQLCISLPFTRNECIYPGLTGTVKATGLWLSERVNFDSQLMVETRGGELDFLAGVVSTCLQFIALDPSLHHALKSVDRFGVRSLNSESERSRYITVLIDRFRRVQATADSPDLPVSLRARLDLDEAIHSLVYLPCSDRFSWWGKLQQEARRTLDPVVEKARHAGYHVQIRPLWGTYADVFNWSKDDLQLDIGGVPGEVSACLRVYAKINDEVLPGRVLFRSS
ncbi:hypothetical protein NUACC21_33870 [Scytonema sp. NUACC21]